MSLLVVVSLVLLLMWLFFFLFLLLMMKIMIELVHVSLRCIFIGLMTLVASRSEEPENTFTLDNEEVNIDISEDQNLQSGYHTIVESLADVNSRLVSEVQGFVQELRRVTLLWEELWLGSLIQIHHDFEKRETQLNDEIKRVNSSSSLSNQEKTTLIREKHIALMKPVSRMRNTLETTITTLRVIKTVLMLLLTPVVTLTQRSDPLQHTKIHAVILSPVPTPTFPMSRTLTPTFSLTDLFIFIRTLSFTPTQTLPPTLSFFTNRNFNMGR